MAKLTHHRVKIDQSTKLLINGSEVLSSKGIKGNIHKVGVGFGTGRHTSGRRLDLLKEVPVFKEPPLPMPLESVNYHQAEPMASPHQRTPPEEKPMSPFHESPKHRSPVRMDMGTQIKSPDVQSEGCDPMVKSTYSRKLSAHVSQRDINLSARSMTQLPDKESIGVSAKPISEISVREQADQVSDGRFEPVMVNTQVNTDRGLLD